MAVLDTRPEKIEVFSYAGDTLTIKVTAPESLTTGKDWHAVLKGARDSDVVDAAFDITTPTAPGGPAYLVLDSETTSALVAGTPVLTRRTAAGVTMIQQYVGEFDVQLSVGGSDPVRTIVQGTLTLELDVTRP